jgi:DNA-binding Lrp family transcriptional regulator
MFADTGMCVQEPLLMRYIYVMPELDSIDAALLALLQNDARIANKELADRVGVAPSTCLDRVARLRRLGYITGYRAHVSPEALGRPVEALLAIQFSAHSRPLVDPFVEAIRALPETRALYHVSGPEDYIVHVACGTIADLQRLVLEQFTTRPEVGHVQTSLIFSLWDGGPLAPYSAQ